MLLNLSLSEVQDLIDASLACVGENNGRDYRRRMVELVGKLQAELDAYPKCPYTHGHTRHWCGYEGCRES